ncbi:MAG: hypothetical protein KatS3mg112_1482 [Thermogutta sp.]|nr:MAG: hypothetical protein KatS3mg112_1482 [Thermogutta sp.]
MIFVSRKSLVLTSDRTAGGALCKPRAARKIAGTHGPIKHEELALER